MPRHVVIDGSNVATEGRENPSLKQLNDVIAAWKAEHPQDLITVVVDATFGHRIDGKEVKAFDDAVDHNEIVAPPAGAIGRGDAFVLAIADKVKATILSNDSYQEFHGEFPWLFDDGRLIGGKPVPHVGWVFVKRVPVRGPTSRKSVRESKQRDGKGEPKADGTKSGRVAKKASKEANQPMPVPKTPPPGKVEAKAAESKAAEPRTEGKIDVQVAVEAARSTSHPQNDLVAFLTFVEKFPVGSTLSATVESYSSHGAYVRIGDVTGYVPLRLMGDPAPRSARDHLTLDEAVTLVVAAFNPGRRGIDLGLPGMVPTVAAVAPRKRGSKRGAAAAPAEVVPAPKPETKPAKAAKADAKPDTKPDSKPDTGKVKAAKQPRSRKAAAKAGTAKDAGAKDAAAKDASAKDSAAKDAGRKNARPARAKKQPKAASAPAEPKVEATPEPKPEMKAEPRKRSPRGTPSTKPTASKPSAKAATAKTETD